MPILSMGNGNPILHNRYTVEGGELSSRRDPSVYSRTYNNFIYSLVPRRGVYPDAGRLAMLPELLCIGNEAT